MPDSILVPFMISHFFAQFYELTNRSLARQ